MEYSPLSSLVFSCRVLSCVACFVLSCLVLASLFRVVCGAPGWSGEVFGHSLGGSGGIFGDLGGVRGGTGLQKSIPRELRPARGCPRDLESSESRGSGGPFWLQKAARERTERKQVPFQNHQFYCSKTDDLEVGVSLG